MRSAMSIVKTLTFMAKAFTQRTKHHYSIMKVVKDINQFLKISKTCTLCSIPPQPLAGIGPRWTPLDSRHVKDQNLPLLPRLTTRQEQVCDENFMACGPLIASLLSPALLILTLRLNRICNLLEFTLSCGLLFMV